MKMKLILVTLIICITEALAVDPNLVILTQTNRGKDVLDRAYLQGIPIVDLSDRETSMRWTDAGRPVPPWPQYPAIVDLDSGVIVYPVPFAKGDVIQAAKDARAAARPAEAALGDKLRGVDKKTFEQATLDTIAKARGLDQVKAALADYLNYLTLRVEAMEERMGAQR